MGGPHCVPPVLKSLLGSMGFGVSTLVVGVVKAVGITMSFMVKLWLVLSFPVVKYVRWKFDRSTDTSLKN